MKHIIIFGALAIMVLAGAGCSGKDQLADQTNTALSGKDIKIEDIIVNNQPEQKTYTFPGVLSQEEITNKQARITTAKGDIVFDLYSDTAPKAVSNFVYLVNEGYYDGIIFHRREEGFVIQGGDPLGNGRGGPGYTFEDELNDQYTYERGIVAMANRGKDTNGSQFFIMLADIPSTRMPKNYTVFGRVTQGMEVVDAIQIGDEMTKIIVENK